MRIAWWPGHSTGRFAGSTWYVDEYALDLARNCLAHLNCDSPGCRDATEYSLIPWMAENAGFVKGVVKDAAGKDAEGRRPHQSSDFSFNNLGITGFFSSSSRIPQAEIKKRGYYYVMGNGGNLEWHTDDDLMPVADKDVLLTDIKVYALAVFRLANATVLPWDWRALLKEFDSTLAKYQAAAGERFDLKPAKDAVAKLDAALTQMAAGLDAGKVKASGRQRRAARAFAPARAVELHHRHALPPRSQQTRGAADAAVGRKRSRPLSGLGAAFCDHAIAARDESGARSAGRGEGKGAGRHAGLTDAGCRTSGCRTSGCRPGAKHLRVPEFELRVRARQAEQVALRQRAARRAQQRELLGGLDAFRGGHDVEASRQARHRAHDRRAIAAAATVRPRRCGRS